MMTFALATAAIAFPAIFFDVRERRIPNLLILAGLGISVAAVLVERGTGDLLFSLSAGLVAFFTTFLFWLIGWLGAGDVKLVGVLGILVGLPEIGIYLVNVALMGAVLGVLYLVFKGRARDSWARLNYMLAARERQLATPVDGKTEVVRLPYAIAIVAGAVMTMMGFSPMI